MDTSAIKFANFNTSSFLVRISSSPFLLSPFRTLLRIECTYRDKIWLENIRERFGVLNEVFMKYRLTARIEMFVEGEFGEFDKYI